MPAKVKVHLTGDGFYLSRAGVAGVEKSEVVDYGDVAELVGGDGRRFLAFLDFDDSDKEPVEGAVAEVGALTEFWCYEAVGLDEEKGEVEVVNEEAVVDVKAAPVLVEVNLLKEEKGNQTK